MNRVTQRHLTENGTTMDRPRVGRAKARWLRIILFGGLTLVTVGVVTFLLAHLGAAAPVVARNSVWIDTVKRGSFLRQVRGLGTLVPEDISWIASRNDARIEKILIWPGTKIEPGTTILVMNNPELQQSVFDADAAVTAAQARLVNVKAQLQGQSLERQVALTKAEGDREIAAAELEVNRRLSKDGLIAAVDLKKSEITAHQLNATYETEKQRFEFTQASIKPQLAVAEGELDQAKAQAALRHGQLDALQVRAGMNGVLQQIAVEVGQRISAGTNVARVADPNKLKAQVKIAETQARDILIGQSASIDTRTSGLVSGRVSRIDPAVQQGTVLVDINFDGTTLPRGVRPDLSVEGTIELEKLDNVVYMGRPAFGQDESSITLFKLSPNGIEAERYRSPGRA